MQGDQLQANHPLVSSATNKSTCSEITHKNAPCTEFSYKQITL